MAKKIATMAADPSADVKLQVAIARRGASNLIPCCWMSWPTPATIRSFRRSSWQNLYPDMKNNSDYIVHRISTDEPLRRSPGFRAMLTHLTERILSQRSRDVDPITPILDSALLKDASGGESGAADAARVVLGSLARAQRFAQKGSNARDHWWPAARLCQWW